MTPEYRLTQIIMTIRAIRFGTPVSKGGGGRCGSAAGTMA